jgi:hypothetical protein
MNHVPIALSHRMLLGGAQMLVTPPAFEWPAAQKEAGVIS